MFAIPGLPVKVKNLSDGTEKTGDVELFSYLNEIGWVHAPQDIYK